MPAAPRDDIVSAPSADTVPAPDYRDRYESLTGVSLRTCPVCHDGQMLVTECLLRIRV